MTTPTPLLKDVIAVGTLPGAPNTGVPPKPGVPTPIKARLDQEYVAGGSYSWWNYYVRSLPWVIDDITQAFGDDTYERMALDPQVAGNLKTLRASILKDAPVITPGADEQHPGYDLAKVIAAEAEHMLERLETPLDQVLWAMADALHLGNKVAEQKYAYAPGSDGKTRLQLVALKVKPRRATSFVVDVYTNVLGLLGLVPGQGQPVQVGTIITDLKDQPNLLPREKFAVWTNWPKDGDPRGSSWLRPAWAPWQDKQQLRPMRLKYAAQFGTPSLVGNTPEGAEVDPVDDSLGNQIGTALTPEQNLLTSLLAFQSGTALALPYGAEVKVIEAQGRGYTVISEMWNDCNGEITKAILTQMLATEEGEHQARAAAETHKDILDVLVLMAKRDPIRMVRNDILRPWVRYNWGEQAADQLTPAVSLGVTEMADMAGLMEAVFRGWSVGYWGHSQIQGLDRLISAPPRDVEADEARAQEAIEQAQATKVPAEAGKTPEEDPAPTQQADTKPKAQVAA